MSAKSPCIKCGKMLDIIGPWWECVYRTRAGARSLDPSEFVGYKCHPKKPCDPERVKKFKEAKNGGYHRSKT